MSKEFESGNFEYGFIDLHNHSAYSEEMPLTTFNEVEVLDYYQQVANSCGKKVCFSITDHDTSLGSYLVYEYLKKHRSEYPDVEFVPGMEINMSLEKVATYDEVPFKDESFVFKKCHLIVHAKKGREQEFFKRKLMYSSLAHKKITVKKNKAVNVGKQILAARNKLIELYGVNIPMNLYYDCAQSDNLYKIRDTFMTKTVEYLRSCGKISSNGYEEIERAIERLYPKTFEYIEDFGYYGRFSIFDLKPMLGDCATICYAHPQTLSFKKFAKIPVKMFKNVDISSLNPVIQNKITKKLNNKTEFEHGLFSQTDIMHAKGIYSDWTGLVKLQLLNNQLLKYNIKIDGYEMTKSTTENRNKDEIRLFEYIANTVVDKMHLLLNFGTDTHFNDDDKAQMNEGRNRFYATHKRTVENPYLKYNRLGRELTNDENSFTISPVLEG